MIFLKCVLPRPLRIVSILPVLLSRVSTLMLTRDIDIVILSVRPSVRLSVCPSGTRWYCMKTAQHIVKVFFHHTVAQSFQFYEH